MQPNQSGIKIIVLSLAITISVFVILISVNFFILFFLRIFGLKMDLWAMIESLSTAIAASAVFGAGYIAYKELSEISNTRHMDVADRLFQELNSEESIAARRWIFQNLNEPPEVGITSLSSEGQQAIKRVLNSMDRIAFLTQAGWIPDDIMMPWMHPMVAKSWEKLEPYVIYERKRRNEPYYYIHVSKLAERCTIWRAKHLEDVAIKWLEDAI